MPPLGVHCPWGVAWAGSRHAINKVSSMKLRSFALLAPAAGFLPAHAPTMRVDASRSMRPAMVDQERVPSNWKYDRAVFERTDTVKSWYDEAQKSQQRTTTTAVAPRGISVEGAASAVKDLLSEADKAMATQRAAEVARRGGLTPEQRAAEDEERAAKREADAAAASKAIETGVSVTVDVLGTAMLLAKGTAMATAEMISDAKAKADAEKAAADAEKAAADEKAAMKAALEERMAMAAQEEEDARLAEEEKMRVEAEKVVARVAADKAREEQEKAVAAAVPILRYEIAQLRTDPVDIDLALLKERVAPYMAVLRADHDAPRVFDETTGAAVVDRHASLVAKLEKAIKAAERAKIEANAKAISDGVDRIVNIVAGLDRRALPDDGTSPPPLLDPVSAAAAAVLLPVEPAAILPKRRWWRRRRYIFFGARLEAAPTAIAALPAAAAEDDEALTPPPSLWAGLRRSFPAGVPF